MVPYTVKLLGGKASTFRVKDGLSQANIHNSMLVDSYCRLINKAIMCRKRFPIDRKS